MKKFLIVIMAVAVILLNATLVLSENKEKKETGFTIKNVCVDEYTWKVFLTLNGEIINISQAFQFTKGGFMPVKCDKNPAEVRSKK